MRRLLLIVAAVMLLGQWSYAAAGAYCAHEEGRSGSAAHWGHHFHAHKASSDAEGSGGGTKGKAALHGDCAFCHAPAVGAPPSTSAPELQAVAPPPMAFALRRDGIVRDPPERPNWRDVAFA